MRRIGRQADFAIPGILRLLGQLEGGSIVHLQFRGAGGIQVNKNLLLALGIYQTADLRKDSRKIGRAA